MTLQFQHRVYLKPITQNETYITCQQTYEYNHLGSWETIMHTRHAPKNRVKQIYVKCIS